MAGKLDFHSSDNVISFSAARQRLRKEMPRAAELPAAAPCTARGKIEVVFITGGQFEAMINGSVGVLSSGDFVRLPDGVAHGFSDIGSSPGTRLSHRFAADISPGFLKELAAALPPYAKALPPCDSLAYVRLKAIAKRWGVTLGSNEAA